MVFSRSVWLVVSVGCRSFWWCNVKLDKPLSPSGIRGKMTGKGQGKDEGKGKGKDKDKDKGEDKDKDEGKLRIRIRVS